MNRLLVTLIPAVLAAAFLAGPAAAKPAFAACAEKELAQNSRGECVKLVQSTLNQWCKDKSALDVDGIFGPRTKAAVRQFQKRVGPDDDGEVDDSGVVGEVTWQELEAANPRDRAFISCLSNDEDLPKSRYQPDRSDEPAKPAGSAGSGPGVRVVFEKNPADHDNSVLTIFKDGKPQGTWRAGSGRVTNDCATGRGWLPNGTYPMTWHKNYQGNVVRGYAMYLGDKRCANGSVTRTQLFIHSWNPWTDSSYQSMGCIKLNPKDVRELYEKWVSLGKPATRLTVTERGR